MRKLENPICSRYTIFSTKERLILGDIGQNVKPDFEEVKSVIQEKISSVNATDMTTIFRCLPRLKIFWKDLPKDLHRSLLEAIHCHVFYLNEAELIDLLKFFAKSKSYAESELRVQDKFDSAESITDTLNEFNIDFSLHEFKQVGAAPTLKDLSKLMRVSESVLETSDESERDEEILKFEMHEESLWEFKQDVISTLKILMKAIIKKLPELTGAQLNQILLRWWQLGFTWELLSKEFRHGLLTSLDTVIPNLDANNLIFILHNLNKFRISFDILPVATIRKLLALLVKKVPDFSLMDTVTVLSALTSLNLAWADLSEDVRKVFLERLMQAGTHFNLPEIQKCLYALAHFAVSWEHIPASLRHSLVEVAGKVQVIDSASAHHVATILWSFAALNVKLSADFFEKMMLKLTPMQSVLAKELASLRQLLTAHKLLEFKVDYSWKVHFAKLQEPNRRSNLEKEIFRYLKKLNPNIEPCYLEENFMHIIDMVEIKTKTAIEVDGPQHFFIKAPGKDYQPTTATRLRNSLLKKMGWNVIIIPFYEWDQVPRKSRLEYLADKLAGKPQSHTAVEYHGQTMNPRR